MASGLYDELIERAIEAEEKMIYDGFRGNTIIINGKKYGRLYNFIRRYGGGRYSMLAPCIAGLTVQGAPLPDDFDFIIAGVSPQLDTKPCEKSYDELLRENSIMRNALNGLMADMAELKEQIK